MTDENMTLVLRFNAFTGKLDDGYLMHTRTKARAGDLMNAAKAAAYLAANPAVRCDPLKA